MATPRIVVLALASFACVEAFQFPPVPMPPGVPNIGTNGTNVTMPPVPWPTPFPNVTNGTNVTTPPVPSTTPFPNVTNGTNVTMPPVPSLTPAPPAKDFDVIWCTEDSNCRLAGDAQATCNAGKCTCSEGFAYGTSPQGAVVPLCLAPGAERKKRMALFRFVFPDGTCPGTDLPLLIATQKAAFTFVPKAVRAALTSASACGSIHTAVGVDMTVGKLADVPADFASQVEAAVREVQELDENVGETMVMTVQLADPEASCQAPNADVSVLFELESGETLCKAVTCRLGFVQDADGVCVLRSRSVEVDDDDLSGGAIAGIVIGVLVAVGIAVAVVAFLVLKKTPDNQTNAPEQQ
eukprot:TRINITY_DN470_c0_g2_i13.p1 TRINITY_DN470_c0_g2~~TRINITY_DN470_c0_g2_i13.p1  ORF type:complete len:352 (+),score=68.73 TRINITY_DN470_c0_g2_i13:67-1122(+)